MFFFSSFIWIEIKCFLFCHKIKLTSGWRLRNSCVWSLNYSLYRSRTLSLSRRSQGQSTDRIEEYLHQLSTRSCIFFTVAEALQFLSLHVSLIWIDFVYLLFSDSTFFFFFLGFWRTNEYTKKLTNFGSSVMQFLRNEFLAPICFLRYSPPPGERTTTTTASTSAWSNFGKSRRAFPTISIPRGSYRWIWRRPWKWRVKCKHRWLWCWAVLRCIWGRRMDLNSIS